jgi:uncharacterized protein (DUF58 family)
MKPGPVLVTAALLALLLGAAGFFSPALLAVWIIFSLCVIPLAILDFLALRLLTRCFTAERTIAGALALGEKAAVQLKLRLEEGRFFPPVSARVFDIYPDGFDCGAFPLKVTIPESGGEVEIEYSVLPVERGEWEFKRVEFLYRSPLGFWRRKKTAPCGSRGRTFPNFSKMTGGSRADIRAVLEQAGLREKRRRGQGMEFMSLREYRKGDAVKAIDWRATGRRGKFIVREYQEEQDQQLLLLLDSGYRLNRAEEGERGCRTQFDSALEAAMLLSWAAVRHGDGVGLGVFGAEDRWLPPRKGQAALTGLMRGLYDVKSAPAPSSLFSALEKALGRLRRRTFIIMISNFREEDGEALSWILPRICRRHLLLLVSLREAEAEFLARRPPRSRDESLESAAAFSYLAGRRQLYRNWEHLGLLTLECPQPELSALLINRYLEVKRSGVL